MYVLAIYSYVTEEFLDWHLSSAYWFNVKGPCTIGILKWTQYPDVDTESPGWMAKRF